jgi:hypothetical protein
MEVIKECGKKGRRRITKRMRERKMVNAKFAWQWSAGDDEFF